MMQPIQSAERPKTPLHSFKQHQVGHNDGGTVSDTRSLFSSPQIPATKLTAPWEQAEEDRTHRGPVASTSQQHDSSHEMTKGIVLQVSASHHETLQKGHDHSPHSEGYPSPRMTKNPTLLQSDDGDRKTTPLDFLEGNSKPDEPLSLGSSSLFTGTNDMDASQLFLGTSRMDANSFFTGLSRAATTGEHDVGTSDAGTLFAATYPNQHFSTAATQPLSSSDTISDTDQIGNEDVGTTNASASTSSSAKAGPVFNTPLQDSVVSTGSKQELSLPREQIQHEDPFISLINHQYGGTPSFEPTQETTSQTPGLSASLIESADAHVQCHISELVNHSQETQLFTGVEPLPRHEHIQPPVEHLQPPVEHLQPPVEHLQPHHNHSQPQLEHSQPPDEHLQPHYSQLHSNGHLQHHHEPPQPQHGHQQESYVHPVFPMDHSYHHHKPGHQHIFRGEYNFVHDQAHQPQTTTSNGEELPTQGSILDAGQTSANASQHDREPIDEHQRHTHLLPSHPHTSSNLQTASSGLDLPLHLQSSSNNNVKSHNLPPGISMDSAEIDPTKSFQAQPQSPPSNGQRIPFDANPSVLTSPAFDREIMGVFSAQESHGNGPTGQPGSYSILELGGELAQSPYFSQARQSPLIQEHFVTRESSFPLSDTLQWKKQQQIETEESVFDQVSLTEDATGSTERVLSVSSPPKERGLASLLDPSTLSAVEDLLNMPKSAAFERGMSRLFKGVKSSATSIFASPLSQVQSKISGSQEAGIDDRGYRETSSNEVTDRASNDSHPEPNQALSGNGGASAIPSVPPHSGSSDQLDAVAHAQPPLPLSIPPPPMGSKRRSSIFPVKSSKAKSPTQQPSFDWAHKQSTLFPEEFEYTPQEAAAIVANPDEGESFSSKVADDFNEQGLTESMHTGSESQEGGALEVSESQPETYKQPSNVVSQSSPSGSDETNVQKVDEHTLVHRKELQPHPFSPNCTPEPPLRVNPVIQGPSSPTALDREAILKKQAAATTLRAEHAGAGIVRANTDKKAKLLEKARELIEKRQQQAGYRSPLLTANAGSLAQTSPLMDSRRNSSESHSKRIGRAGSISSVGSSRASVDLANDQRQMHEQPSRLPVLTRSHQTDTDRYSEYPHISTSQGLGVAQQTSSTIHELHAENDKLKQQLESLRIEVETLRKSRVDSTPLNPQLEQELRDELSKMETELRMSSAAFSESSARHSQQLEDLARENQQLCEKLALIDNSPNDQDQAQDSDLASKYQHLEAELEQTRRIYPEYQAALSEIEKLSNVYEENEQLRVELERIQHKSQDQISEQSQQATSLNGEMFSPEQLSKEAEGLRRQLKGQKEEMKLLQENVKRSENEKRELISKLEHLERLLADAEKHRNELKSHQAMKDEAYKVIQERLVASFEEEKAQYMDEEAFKMVKLEHRYSLLQEELETLQAVCKKKQEEIEQTQLTEQQTVPSLTERMKQLDTELEARLNLINSHEATIDQYKKREEQLMASLASAEERTALLEQELIKADNRHADAHLTADVKIAKSTEQTLELESLALELDQALSREQTLKRELETVSQTSKQIVQSFGGGNFEGELTLQQIEYDRLTGQASKWQEECLMVQEEKMRVEDQLQRAEMELIAAKTEIGELEAIIGAGSKMQSMEENQSQLEQELEETKAQLQLLTKQLEERNAVLNILELSHERNNGVEAAFLEKEELLNSRLSDLAQQLDVQRSEYIQLEKELGEAKNGLADSQTLQALLDEERRAKSLTTNDLEGQLQRSKEILLEKQKEVEQMTLELDNMTYKSAIIERDLAQLQSCQSEFQMERDNSAETIAMLQSQLDDTSKKHDDIVAEISGKETTLKEVISTLETTKQELEQQLRLQTDSTEKYKNETSHLQQSLQQLQMELSLLTEKTSSKDEMEISRASQLAQLNEQVSSLQNEFKQAQEQLKLVVDLFGKLLRTSEEPEELAALETTVVSILSEVKPLGVPVQSLSQVCIRLIELQRLEVDKKGRMLELETELQNLKSSSQEQGHGVSISASKVFSAEHATDHGTDVQELQQKLIGAEHGIAKLQQFLQEFQNEKKRAIYELQQQLQDSEQEVSQVRSQLAKAQAMLLAKPSDSTTPTQEVIPLVPMSPTRSRSQSPNRQQLQERQQQQQSHRPSSDNSRTLLSDDMFESTEQIRHEAVLALEPLRLQKAELERTLLDLKHRYELSQKENDSLLSALEKENKQLRAKAERMSPDMSSEHLERIRELELELVELTRQLKTAQREREFARQDMRTFKAELAKLKARN
ncbi:hypothetical protein BGX21_008405 [Mortierella sp. AD011]|nr:hypothetical protein BGX20_008461 [Mortierella sp. AD010]KAF9397878.1 hypothetical protein BGX21_008405 [Mortierella sp. AD011]